MSSSTGILFPCVLQLTTWGQLTNGGLWPLLVSVPLSLCLTLISLGDAVNKHKADYGKVRGTACERRPEQRLEFTLHPNRLQRTMQALPSSQCT